ncbi:exodeoxyribonuclease VII small subunit [Mitsuaria sp. WAJ17]|uniref:exodeoxyribonuclease VII small subunit n=1 Tax=Mitsuaria sp. WAJ17 TaxID=2761452 RepID=UPI0015FFB290|nr:exodeoxyribonuclease VII small subunit [Mitsuaria sp. WAJ17]MBB2484429.1 exodeoxyribonuclease VII small subunit [Mitsuaria sp. WAJ17]
MSKATATPRLASGASSDEPGIAQKISYEQALDELERLVAAMEAGQLPLDQLLDSYRRGAELLALCRDRLQAVEQQVKVLETGEMRPWEDE